MNKAIFLQLSRFGVVGLSAAAIHFSIVVGLVEFFTLNPLLANALAFCVAFGVSYSGHRYWTFGESQVQHRLALPRLMVVSLANFVANEGMFYFFLSKLHFSYPLALFCVLSILPFFTFVVSKFWVFR